MAFQTPRIVTYAIKTKLSLVGCWFQKRPSIQLINLSGTASNKNFSAVKNQVRKLPQTKTSSGFDSRPACVSYRVCAVWAGICIHKSIWCVTFQKQVHTQEFFAQGDLWCLWDTILTCSWLQRDCLLCWPTWCITGLLCEKYAKKQEPGYHH